MATSDSAADGLDARNRLGRRSPIAHAVTALWAILRRDAAQLARGWPGIIVNLVLPAVFLVAISAGFSGLFGRSLAEPYGTYVTLSDYLLPGLAGLVLFLAVVPLALALLRQSGAESLKFLLAAPLPRWFVVFGKLIAAGLLATLQAALFIVLARLAGFNIDLAGWLMALPAAFLAAMMLAAVTLALFLFLRPLRRSTFMLLVVFPALLLSSALYPLWRFTDYGADYLNVVAQANPFTHAVELIRYASEGKLAGTSLAVVVGVGVVAFVAVVRAIRPRSGMLAWRRRPGEWSGTPGE